MKPRVVAIIPARKGSKGIPDKNKQYVGGKPLWLWSLDAARLAEGVDEVVVTSDDPEILTVASWAGVTCVERPAELAIDTMGTDPVLVHATKEVGAEEDIIVLLQPTVPVRREGLVDDCLKAFAWKKGEVLPGSIVTANRLHFVWHKTWDRFYNTVTPRVRRQDVKPEDTYWHEDGSVYVCYAQDLISTGDRVVYPVLIFETEITVDIDSVRDLEIADILLREGF